MRVMRGRGRSRRARHRPGHRVSVGDYIAARRLQTATGGIVSIPDPDVRIHLQFRRFAGCPICNLHLRSVARRVDEIAAAGVREVAVFHAPDEDLLPHIGELPFAVIGDPGKRLYREFGVEARAAALLDPRAWPGILKSVATAAALFLAGRAAPPKATPHGGRLGLPADFLVDTDGRVVAVKYGRHADDQWSVDELLAAAHGQGDGQTVPR